MGLYAKDLVIWQAIDGQEIAENQRFRAQFTEGATFYPLTFTGPTEAAVREKASAWLQGEIELLAKQTGKTVADIEEKRAEKRTRPAKVEAPPPPPVRTRSRPAR